MSKPYNQLCDENKYLYSQLENCTMLMGKATRDGDFKLHMEYYFAKMGIKDMIDRNLDLIDEIWNTPILTPNQLKEQKRLMTFEHKIIDLYKADNRATLRTIAKQLYTSKSIVENVLTTHFKKPINELIIPT